MEAAEQTATKAAHYWAVGATDRTTQTFMRAKAVALDAYRSRRGSAFAKEAAAFEAARKVYQPGFAA